MGTPFFGTGTIFTLRPKILELFSDKMIQASTLSAFKSKAKFWNNDNLPCRLCKMFVKDLYLFVYLFYKYSPMDVFYFWEIIRLVGIMMHTKNYIVVNNRKKVFT